MSHEERQDVAVTLHEMPAWADVPIGDTKALASIESVVRSLGSGDVTIVMSGMRRFIEECRKAAGFDVAAMSKIFVLNRYLFNVPEFVPLSQPGFGGFVGVPVQEGCLNELWPWTIDSRGELQLTGFFRGYLGETFLALEEATDMHRRYGPRRKP